MSQFSDDKVERLRISGFDEGQVNDSEQAWLKSATGWQSGDSENINDLWTLYLEMVGFGGEQLNDALYAFLGAEGYDPSDHLQDRLAAFWADTKILPLPPLP